jgi:hypothetical protein
MSAILCDPIEHRGHRLFEAVNPNTRTNPPSNLTEMGMVAQIDHLADSGHISEEPEGFLRPKIVERLHDVVGDKGHWLPRLSKFVIAGDAKCQIELKTSAFRQLRSDF